MHRSLGLALATVLVVGPAGASFAEDEEADYLKKGAYFSANIGINKAGDDEEVGGRDPFFSAGGELGLRVHRGYSFGLSFDYLNEDAYSLLFDWRFYPLGFAEKNTRFQPFVTLGLGILDPDQEELGFATRGRIGLDYYLSESLSLVFAGGYTAPWTDRIDDTGYFMLTGGIQYRID